MDDLAARQTQAAGAAPSIIRLLAAAARRAAQLAAGLFGSQERRPQRCRDPVPAGRRFTRLFLLQFRRRPLPRVHRIHRGITEKFTAARRQPGQAKR